jgi:hypothetical protein
MLGPVGFEGPLRAKTASFLLLLILVLCFAAGAYELHRVWAEHEGRHGPHETPPLGLPNAPASLRHHIKLGT